LNRVLVHRAYAIECRDSNGAAIMSIVVGADRDGRWIGRSRVRPLALIEP
jgi:hypothetical protein